MTDPIPDHRNRLAYTLGRLFHPYLISIPTLAAVLADLSFGEAFFWMAMVVAILILPLVVTTTLLRRQNRYVYQRATRTPIYLTFWVSLLICIGVLTALSAPMTLLAGILALTLWIPLQLLINTYVTKVSTHAAVASGCMTGLLLLGKLNHPLLVLSALAVVGLTLWARVTTRNHTVEQVVMGTLTGATSVLIVFPLILR